MEQPGYVGINEAARLTGKNKAQISKDAKESRLPFARNEKGHMTFQVVDLQAKYGALRNPITGERSGDAHRKSLGEKTSVTTDLAAVLMAKDETISSLKAQIEDLKTDRDRWSRQAVELLEQVKMLPAPASNQNQPAATTGGFLARIFGVRT